MDFRTAVPLFASGRAAMEHGMKDLRRPSRRAVMAITDLRLKLIRKRE